jgi:hypothetical protein
VTGHEDRDAAMMITAPGDRPARREQDARTRAATRLARPAARPRRRRRRRQEARRSRLTCPRSAGLPRLPGSRGVRSPPAPDASSLPPSSRPRHTAAWRSMGWRPIASLARARPGLIFGYATLEKRILTQGDRAPGRGDVRRAVRLASGCPAPQRVLARRDLIL